MPNVLPSEYYEDGLVICCGMMCVLWAVKAVFNMHNDKFWHSYVRGIF